MDFGWQSGIHPDGGRIDSHFRRLAVARREPTGQLERQRFSRDARGHAGAFGVTAPREPHGWAELRHNLFKMNVEIEWFEKYATKRPFTWEKAPGEDKKDAKTTTDQ